MQQIKPLSPSIGHAVLCFSSLSETYFSNGPFIIYSLRRWGSEGFFWGGWVRIWDLVFRGNGRGISSRQESINGGGGGSGVEGGARRILDLDFSGNGREGISCRQGTLKEGL